MTVVFWNEKSGAKRVDTSSDLANLPKIAGTLAVTLDTNTLYIYDAETDAWVYPISGGEAPDVAALEAYTDEQVAALEAAIAAAYEAADGVVSGGCLALSGGTLTGPLTLAADPTEDLEIATKQYADSLDLSGSYVGLTGNEDVEGVKYLIDGFNLTYSGGLYNQVKAASDFYKDLVLVESAPSSFQDEYRYGRPTVVTNKNAYKPEFNPLDGMIYVCGYRYIQVINPYTNAVVSTIDLSASHRGYNGAFCPVSGTVWTANHNTGAADLKVISYSAGSAVTVAISGVARDICWCPTDERMYYSESAYNAVNYIDPVTLTVGGSISTSGNYAGYVCHVPTQNRIYVGGANVVSILDVATKQMVNSVATSGNSGTYQLAYIPSVDRVYVTCYDRNNIHVIDPVSETLEATISTGNGPTALAYNPVIDRVFVSNYTARSVTIINPHTRAVVGTLTHSVAEPTGVAFCPETKLMYVSTLTNGSIITISSS